MPDPEPLLLIHDQEAEILEEDIRGKEPMGSDDDIRLPLGQGKKEFPLFFRRSKTTQGSDTDRVVRQPLLEGSSVLLNQDRGRRQDCYLFPVLNRLEGSSNRHLRFAITDVSADQPVHGSFYLHVPLDLQGDLPLVRCILEKER